MQIQEPVEWMHMGSEVLPQIRTRKPQPRRSSRPHWPVQSLYSPSSQLPAARAWGTGGRFSRIIGQKSRSSERLFSHISVHTPDGDLPGGDGLPLAVVVLDD